MSLVQDVTTLIPSTQMVKEVLHREAGIEDAVAWLWGHANSDKKAQEFLRFDLGVQAYLLKDFGSRPTVYAYEYGGFIAIAENGEQVHLDRLVVLAPVFATNKRKAEGEAATAAEITSFRPILVKN